MIREAFDAVIHSDRDDYECGRADDVGTEAEQDRGELVFQCGAEDAQTHGKAYHAGDPEAVESIFRLPNAAAALADPQWQAVVEEVAVRLCCNNTEPVGEGDFKFVLC